MASPKGRGRLSSLELLPPECDDLVHTAAQALSARDQTQDEIYAEFFEGCQRLMRESHGELEFTIPSKSSFNRWSIRCAKLTRRLDQTREIMASLKKVHTPEDSDELTIMAGEAIKSLVLHMLADTEIDGVTAKDVAQFASAVLKASQAQKVSSDNLEKRNTFKEKVEEAVDVTAKVKGLTSETVKAIKAEILGVAA